MRLSPLHGGFSRADSSWYFFLQVRVWDEKSWSEFDQFRGWGGERKLLWKRRVR